MLNKIKESTKMKMDKSVSLLAQELSKLRTGRASLALLDGVKVEYYGSTLPLNQVASISIPEPRLMIIQPWDKTTLAAIEKAIFKSAIGLTPNNDGNVIRLPIPPLTTERRDELVVHPGVGRRVFLLTDGGQGQAVFGFSNKVGGYEQ